ncbi:MAG: M6 family metalloprotease domain-containing protein [Armatimonadota bacterium]
MAYLARIASIISLVIVSSLPVFAVSANPALFSIKQPSGELVQIRLRGDEHKSWHEDVSGYLAMKAASGAWVYAQIAQGAMVPTPWLVSPKSSPQSHGIPRLNGAPPALLTSTLKRPGRQMSAANSPAPIVAKVINPIGSLKNLVILVNFSDVIVPYPVSSYESLLNTPGYDDGFNRCSVNGYYQRVSRGQLSVDSSVFTVTLPRPMAFYGADVGDETDVNAPQMVSDAIAALDSTVDFSQFDGDGDGVVDGLDVIHAGLGQEYGGNSSDNIWSHQSWVGWPNGVAVDGVRITKYHTEPAQRGWQSTPSSLGITSVGVICHEFFHVLDMPDLYDYTYTSAGAGDFCIMAGGVWRDNGGNPCDPSAYIRMKLGWVAATVVDSASSLQMRDVDIDNGPITKIPLQNTTQQYFLLESCNRLAVGPSQGVLFWHVDESRSDNDNRDRYMVDLEEASGTQDLYDNTSGGDASDFYHMYDQLFSRNSSPNSMGYDGQSCAWSLRNFRQVDGIYWLDVCPADLTLHVIMSDLLSGTEMAGRTVAVDYLDSFSGLLGSAELSLDTFGSASTEPAYPASQVRVRSVNCLAVRTAIPSDRLVNVDLIGGDIDGGGSIDLFDYVELDRRFSQTSIVGDVDGDGSVNLFDYIALDRNFGAQGEE